MPSEPPRKTHERMAIGNRAGEGRAAGAAEGFDALAAYVIGARLYREFESARSNARMSATSKSLLSSSLRKATMHIRTHLSTRAPARPATRTIFSPACSMMQRGCGQGTAAARCLSPSTRVPSTNSSPFVCM